MSRESREELVQKLEAALAEGHGQTQDAFNALHAKASRIKEELDGLLDDVVSRRVKAVSLGDVSRDRFMALKGDMDDEGGENIEQAMAQIARLEAALGDSTEAGRAVQSRLAQFENALGEKQQECDSERERADTATAELAQSVAGADEQRDAAQSLSEQFSASEQRLKDSEKRSAGIEKKHTQVSSELDATRGRLSELEGSVAESAEVDKANREEAARLQQMLAELHEALQAANSRVSSLESELGDIRRSIEGNQDKEAELNASLDSRASELAEASNLTVKLKAELQSVLEKAESQASAINDMKATEAELRDEISSLQSASSEIEGRENLVAADLDASRVQLIRVREESETARQLASSADDLKKLLQAERERADAAESRLQEEAASGTKSTLALQLAEALEAQERMQDKLVALRTEVDRFRGEKKVETGEVALVGRDTEGRKRHIGQILLEAGIVTEEQLESALELQKTTPNKGLGEILVIEKYASEDVVAQALACQLKVDFVRLADVKIAATIAELVPAKIAKQHMCAPLSVDGGTVVLAMANPFDLIAIEDVERATGLTVSPVVATPSDIAPLVYNLYTKDS